MSLPLPQDPPWVAVDTETSGLHPDDGARVACVSITWMDDYWEDGEPELKTLAFPFDQGVRDKLPTTQLDFDFGGSGKDPNLGRAEWDELLEWLSRQQLVMHNAKFDLTLLKAGTRHWPGIELIEAFYWDTMLCQGVIHPQFARGLDATVKRLGIGDGKVGLDAIKGWLKANKHPTTRYDLAPWPVVEPYVTTDTEDTAGLYMYQQDWLAQGDHFPNEMTWVERSFGLMRALYMMEQRGIGYDDDRSLEAARVLEERALEIEKTLPFKCSPTEADAYFYGKLKLNPAMRKKKVDGVSQMVESFTLDEEQVRSWVRQDIPYAREFTEVTKIRRAVSMWYQGYPDKIGNDGRLRCTFRQGHVKSGRMSVERVQLQAMPKADKYKAVGSQDRLEVYRDIPDIRDLITTKPGHGLWNLDLSQAELRVASHYARCERMNEMLARGMDIHGETTKGALHVQPDAPDWKFKRDIAKRLTFGGIFQIGGETFMSTMAKLADIHLSPEEAYQYVNNWRTLYPEFGYAYRAAEKAVMDKGYVRLVPNTDYELRSYFGERDWPNTAWNRIVQGSLALIFGLWLEWIEKEIPGYAVLTVHDSVVLEAPLDEGDSIAARVAEYGANLFTEAFGTTMKVDTDRW